MYIMMKVLQTANSVRKNKFYQEKRCEIKLTQQPGYSREHQCGSGCASCVPALPIIWCDHCPGSFVYFFRVVLVSMVLPHHRAIICNICVCIYIIIYVSIQKKRIRYLGTFMSETILRCTHCFAELRFISWSVYSSPLPEYSPVHLSFLLTLTPVFTTHFLLRAKLPWRFWPISAGV